MMESSCKRADDVKYLRHVIDKLWSILDDIDTYADLKIADTDPNNPFRKIRHKSAGRFEYVKSDGYHLFIDGVQIDELPAKE